MGASRRYIKSSRRDFVPVWGQGRCDQSKKTWNRRDRHSCRKPIPVPSHNCIARGAEFEEAVEQIDIGGDQQ